MSMYGDCHVDQAALKAWVSTLTTDGVSSVNIGGSDILITPEYKRILDLQLQAFSAGVASLKPGDDWRTLQEILSPPFYNTFFRIGNNAIRIANYYECFVSPSNIKTYKKIIKGFDYQEFGAVKLYDGKMQIGEIGIKSDLIWSVFFDYFILQDKFGGINHVLSNHEIYMSIQLFNVANLTNNQIQKSINEILLKVSMEHDLDFSIIEVDAAYKLEGEAKLYGSQFHGTVFEHIPTLYFNNALHTQDVRLAFLGYYQVLEYFFVRAQNCQFLNEYQSLSMPPINHSELRKVLQHYKNSLNERESLKLVLTKSIDMSKFKAWIAQDGNRTIKYCNSQTSPIDLSKSDEKIVAKLTERIYSMRCSIAHAKGDVDEYVAVPFVSDSEVLQELELVRYIAYETLKACSTL